MTCAIHGITQQTLEQGTVRSNCANACALIMQPVTHGSNSQTEPEAAMQVHSPGWINGGVKDLDSPGLARALGP